MPTSNSISTSYLKYKIHFRYLIPRTLSLRALVAHLEQKGVEVKPIQEHGEGLFAWCRDPEGNYLELWQDSQA